jgi:hypothetical protein
MHVFNAFHVCYQQSKCYSFYYISEFLLEAFLASYAYCITIIVATMHSIKYALHLMHNTYDTVTV